MYVYGISNTVIWSILYIILFADRLNFISMSYAALFISKHSIIYDSDDSSKKREEMNNNDPSSWCLLFSFSIFYVFILFCALCKLWHTFKLCLPMKWMNNWAHVTQHIKNVYKYENSIIEHSIYFCNINLSNCRHKLTSQKIVFSFPYRGTYWE